MNCDLIIEDLQAFLDNELQTMRRSEVQTHLQICKDCSQMVNDLNELSSLMRNADIPTPNLLTGQELLSKAASLKKQTNPITKFLASTYEFFFKYKASILATVTAATLIVVVINIRGVKKGNISFYSEQEKSSTVALQENSLNQDMAKTAPAAAPPESESPKLESNIESKESTSITKAPATLEPLAKPQTLVGEVDGVVSGTINNLDENRINEGVLGGVAKDNLPPPAPSPSDIPKETNSSKIEPFESKQQDELAKNNFVDKKNLNEQKAKNIPNEVSSSEAVEINTKEDSKAKSRDLATIQPTQSRPETTTEKSGARAGISQKNERESYLSGRTNSELDKSSSGSMAQPKRAEAPAKVAEKTEGEFRQQVKQIEIVISAKDLQATKTQLTKIAEDQKGNIVVRTKDNKVVSVLLRIPNTNLENTLLSVRKVGKVIKEKSMLIDELTKDKKDEDRRRDKQSGEKIQVDSNYSNINITFVE